MFSVLFDVFFFIVGFVRVVRVRAVMWSLKLFLLV